MSNETYEQILQLIWNNHERLLRITSQEITNKWIDDLEKVRHAV